MGDYHRGIIVQDKDPWVFQRKLHIKDRPPGHFLQQEALHGKFWTEGCFTVPDDVSEARVQLRADAYMKKYGRVLEEQSFSVHCITWPELYHGLLPVAPDRRKYVIHALVSRRPQVMSFDIPDRMVPEMEKIGLRLAE